MNESTLRSHGLCLLAALAWPMLAQGTTLHIDLGTADSFSVLAGSNVTNTGATAVKGNLGVWSGSVISGFPPGSVSGGTIHAGDAAAMQAQSDLTAAYVSAAGDPCGQVLTGQDLGGLTLTPGAYCFASSAQLTGVLTLNALGDPNAVFLFQIATSLTTANGSSVLFSNGGNGDSVFWQMGSSATLGASTVFAGNILALTSITLNTGASIGCGRALARNDAVTLDTNQISIDTAGCETTAGSSLPEPSSASLLLLIGAMSLLRLCRRCDQIWS